jgi:hypothetical protein
MNETNLLDTTLDILDEKGTCEAYDYMIATLDPGEVWCSQIYNFLYCLAASSGKRQEAIQWLKEAILDKGLWYRPEVFEDEDLDSIRQEKDFLLCLQASKEKYDEALKKTSTVLSWKEKTKNKFLLVLHGNQQNNEISQSVWSDFKDKNYQVEYLQSREIDSYNLYRWSDDGDGPKQLFGALETIKSFQYEKVILAGFSAGCQTILRAITEEGIKCDQVILFSPWIPIIESRGHEVIEALKKNKIEVVIICGQLDEDCMPLCKQFEDKANELGFKYKSIYLKEMGHAYPKDLTKMI